MSRSAAAARALLDPEDRDLVDFYAADHPGTPYHVVAAFVLAGQEPPHSLAFTAKQSAVVQAHYEKYHPNGPDVDPVADVGPLVAAKR